jgi:flavin reductase (DIM6/NTAB) family NADH-FMN oxidoreductase RutF
VAISPDHLTAALGSWAGAVCLLTIRDDRDDIGATVTAFCPLSQDPPLVLVSLMAASYPAEVLSAVAKTFAVTLLGQEQRVLAGRFAAEGRPGARHMLDDVPHSRGEMSGALIPGNGLAALECSVEQLVVTGDHVAVVAGVLAIPYVSEAGAPLIRFRRRYPRVD